MTKDDVLLSPTKIFDGRDALSDTKKRMSIRNVATTYEIPARTVARAIENGQLPALKTVTATGRERYYIYNIDADAWFKSLFTVESVLTKEQV